MRVRVLAEAEVWHTEDPAKVAKALTNLFSGNQKTGTLDASRSYILIEGNELSSLEKFRMIIQRDRIRAAAGAVLRRSVDGNRVTVFLNKQVAYASHVSFCEPEGESPLGPIRVVIETDAQAGIIDWITGGVVERLEK